MFDFFFAQIISHMSIKLIAAEVDHDDKASPKCFLCTRLKSSSFAKELKPNEAHEQRTLLSHYHSLHCHIIMTQSQHRILTFV